WGGDAGGAKLPARAAAEEPDEPADDEAVFLVGLDGDAARRLRQGQPPLARHSSLSAVPTRLYVNPGQVLPPDGPGRRVPAWAPRTRTSAAPSPRSTTAFSARFSSRSTPPISRSGPGRSALPAS